MATLDVTEKVNVLVDAIGWESFCEELMERMDEDALDTVCDRIAPRYGVELAGSRYDSTGTTIEHYLGDAEEFYPDEHPQILEREVGYIFPLMEVEPTICIELKDE